MKTYQHVLSFLLMSFLLLPVQAQKAGLESITPGELKAHMKFLASDELEGRDTGDPGMQIAARYLAVQAEALGLQALDEDKDYMQPYIIEEKTYDRENSHITIIAPDSSRQTSSETFYMLTGLQGDHTLIEGEVVFAGYGINSEEHGYNDFKDIDIKDKMVIVMNRAPLNEEGTEAQFDDAKWSEMQNFQYKLQYIFSQQPRAVMLVMDPKSGMQSIEDIDPTVVRFLSRSRGLKTDEESAPGMSNMPGLIVIHRNTADQLLATAGKNLKDLQLEIDRKLEPQSFHLEGVRVKIELRMKISDLEVYNVFGLIEGSDPKLKDEVVIYMAHYDHVGTDGEGGVFNGADDNASGTVALIEIAEAFKKEKKTPRRSIGILWVSAEEIGLFGSEYFSSHPLVERENIAAVINLDMVGRTMTSEDEQNMNSSMTIQAGDSVKVIGGLQSKVLMAINESTLAEMGLIGNYKYNNLEDPNRFFYRSDHINFARKDIPVLYYSTGTHSDYHGLGDVEEALDYDKFLKMTRFCFKAGHNVAQYKGAIEVDNPMSTW